MGSGAKRPPFADPEGAGLIDYQFPGIPCGHLGSRAQLASHDVLSSERPTCMPADNGTPRPFEDLGLPKEKP